MPTRKRHNRDEEEAHELAALSQAPRVGEVWWCEGAALGLNDGGKTRPVLVVGFEGAATVQVFPLTTQKPAGGAFATQVTHKAGMSWLVGDSVQTPRSVAKVALLSPLGMWPRFAAWKHPPPAPRP